ncbi:hypothetical protein ACFQL7_24620 [Halocatena marina]|uniref:DUF3592 domain-containing protein n=2 Tax=Halocatena marina TaxID=2934937 RepID=A0ABD5YYM6_9EURY
MFMFVFIPIVWTPSSLVIDHWLFPTAVGKLFLVFLGLPLLVMVGITRLAIALPTGITTASRIPVDTVDHVTFEEHRFGPTQITIHYENDGDMKNRQLRLPWPSQTAEEFEASRRVFEVHGIDTDRT